MPHEIAPGFLVAAPSLRDPSFVRTVVLVVEHGESGSLGFVVNRPSPVRFTEVATALGIDLARTTRVPVFVGGPVAPQSGWVLFDPRDVAQDHLDDAIVISESLAVSASRRLLSSIASSGRSARQALALGYAGWSTGQLDEEFRQGVWLPAPVDPRVVFETEPEERWERVLRSLGIEPGAIVNPPRDLN
ncbi:MAG: YqgE/AlgH family protein [Sandaracinus sp.]